MVYQESSPAPSRRSALAKSDRHGSAAKPRQNERRRRHLMTEDSVSSFDKIGGVGAGMMGSEIALVFALAGHATILSDRERAFADRALERLERLPERGASAGTFGRTRRRKTPVEI
jgi:hypothetical protein